MRSFAVAMALLAAAWAQTPQSKQVEVFGQKIHYVEAGSGPNVILLHGLGGDSTNWAATVPALASNYHVWAPDQIGFGASDKPLINYRVGTLVDFLEGFCKKAGIDKAVVVGNSLGGWTAMAFTLAHPERVQKLVLVDSAGYSFNQSPVKPTRQMLAGLNPSTVDGAKGRFDHDLREPGIRHPRQRRKALGGAHAQERRLHHRPVHRFAVAGR